MSSKLAWYTLKRVLNEKLVESMPLSHWRCIQILSDRELRLAQSKHESSKSRNSVILSISPLLIYKEQKNEFSNILFNLTNFL